MLTAIFGGTFNPPHIGHYEMLAALQKRRDVGEIWLMPDRVPPHKVCDFLASDRDRIAMCERLAEDFSKVRLCLVEFEREGKSYTFDTLSVLQKQYPNKSFALVCGGDMLTSFDTWHRYRELLTMAPFIIFRRIGEDKALFDRKLAQFRKLGMRVTVPRSVISAVSSTEIRRDIANAGNLLPKKVYDYIMTEEIYRG